MEKDINQYSYSGDVMAWLKNYKKNGKKPESDAYGFKAMLHEMNVKYRCPNDGSFLVWKDKNETIMQCQKCKWEKRVEGTGFKFR